MDPLSGGQWVLFFTTLSGIALTLYKDARTRAWAVEDRRLDLERAAMQRKEDLAAIVDQAKAEAEALHIKTAAAADALAQETRRLAEETQANSLKESARIQAAQNAHALRLESQMETVATAADKAFTEANHVNAKIATNQALAAAQILKRDAQMADLHHSVEHAAKERIEIAALDKVQREETASKLAEVVRVQSDAVRTRLDESAAAVRDRLDQTAGALRDKVDNSAREVRDRLELTVTMAKADADRVVSAARVDAGTVLDQQTRRMLDAIDAAARVTGSAADQAYHEANSVNVKIEALHRHNELQAAAIAKLLDVVQAQHALSPAPAAPPAPVPVEVVNFPEAPK